MRGGDASRRSRTALRAAALAGVWLSAAAATAALDGRVDLGSQAMPLVLAAAVTGLWLPPGAAARRPR